MIQFQKIQGWSYNGKRKFGRKKICMTKIRENFKFKFGSESKSIKGFNMRFNKLKILKKVRGLSVWRSELFNWLLLLDTVYSLND